ncbi:hypothetical protein ACFQL1_24030 [Halomicroarcula sp. GCM10025709]|uniref:DUF7344 domain-containing protein n=1 Tax=Haloarcula TaxID=2237 RepID=UPI0024C2B954|nr:hypothetical protein [Halomicroarcula sp. YJ-61-S]
MSNTSTTTSGSADQTPTEPEVDRVSDALRHGDRRHILLTIADAELADEERLSLQELDLDSTDRPAVELVHRHLPKLAEAGYIEWDREMGTITRGPNYDEVGPLLQLIQNHSDELPGEWSL